ncbi:site-specific integrase [Methyloceanibacter sp.]|uniref:tyrosine-type recombinase/integrase n=1 Tax=Methyloceanibacter sp. TaxID=1965321 RepID=UPI002C8FDF60|nr:site-specific integrase [Methyloceanibacter sp.]HML91086.1 site-specific integrase [Methyloceanibacter sp.]
MAKEKKRPKTERVCKAKNEGLYLQTVGESRSWLLRYRIGGREHWIGLGPYRHGKRIKGLSLDEAKKKARKLRADYIDKGIDPLAERRKEKAARLLAEARDLSFEVAAKQWFEQNKDNWTNAKVRKAVMSSLRRYAFPKIGSMSVRDIETGDVLRVLDPHWREHPETLDKVRLRIEQILSWATIRGFRAPGDNPARWKNNLAAALPARSKLVHVSSFKSLPYPEMPVFWQRLSERKGAAAAALRLVILTATRSGEVRGARWSEVNFDNKLWVIPGKGRSDAEDGVIDGTKTRDDYIIPLSDAALNVINDQPRANELIFVGPNGQLSENAVMMLLKKRMKVDAQQHGFRSTFNDWARDTTGFSDEVIRFCLGHGVGNDVEARYRRTRAIEKRRKLMAQWAAFVLSPPRAGEIVPIRAA